MAELVVIVPSRGRPEKARELAEVFAETCTGDTELTFAVDDNDPTRDEYSQLPGRTSVGLMESTNMGQALHKAATFVAVTNPAAFGNPYALAFMGDDHRPRTEGWDQAYIDALKAMGTGIVYGNDLLQGANLPTQVAVTADIVRALGFMAPPELVHLYFDNFWRDLGDAAGCLKYLPDVVVEHVHPMAGKAAWDEGYTRVNDPTMYDRDRVAYEEYRRTRFEADVAKVRGLRAEARRAALGLAGQHEWRLFPEGTIPVYTTAEWYAGREHAPHLEQDGHRERLMYTASAVAREAMAGPRTLVDLGAGDGGLLSLLGPGIRAWGYDLAPANLEAAKERGVDVRYGDVLVDELEWGGIAVATEMLEHLIDPHAYVARIREHSEILVASSPRLETGEHHYEFHTWAWDPEGYRALMEQGGWRVKRQQAVGAFQIVVAVR